jgi:hypothetical protein
MLRGATRRRRQLEKLEVLEELEEKTNFLEEINVRLAWMNHLTLGMK